MNLFRTTLGIVAALAVTLAAGIIQGRLSNRWGITTALLEAALQLEQQAPESVGKWQLKARRKLDEASSRMLQSAGQFVATYENTETGESVSMFVIVGPMGPTAEHTPEVCFPGNSFRQLGARVRVNPDPTRTDQPDLFWMATFESKSLEGGFVRAYWAWTANGKWSAPDDARLEFIRAPFLYKIQVQGLLRDPNPESPDPAREFLAAFLPAAGRIFHTVSQTSGVRSKSPTGGASQ